MCNASRLFTDSFFSIQLGMCINLTLILGCENTNSIMNDSGQPTTASDLKGDATVITSNANRPDNVIVENSGTGIVDSGENPIDSSDNNDTQDNFLADSSIRPVALDSGRTINRDGEHDESIETGCGNGRLEVGEVCDDGNTHNGDGCSFACQCQDTEIVGDYVIADISSLNNFVEMISDNECVILNGNLEIDVSWVETTGRTDLKGFENLTAVTGVFSIHSHATGNRGPNPPYIFYSTCLSSLSGLENLDHVGRSLEIFNCAELNTIDGLKNVTFVGCNPTRDIQINCPNVDVAEVEAFINRLSYDRPACGEDGVLRCPLYEVRNKADIERLTNCKSSISISIYDSDLTDLHGLENLETVSSVLNISGNTSLSNIDGLASLKSINNLTIGANPVLNNIDPICAIDEDTFIESLSIVKNSSLADICDLNFTEARSVTIESNNFSNLKFLRRLKTVELAMLIIGNNSLIDLAGLDSLVSVGSLEIGDNTLLQSVDGLNSLKNVYLNLFIHGNDSLTSLRDLENLSYVGVNIHIKDNASLPTCEANWLGDAIGTDNIGGIIIEGNNDSEICP